MPWEQILVFVIFLVFPLLQTLAKKRAKDRQEHDASTDLPSEFQIPDSPRDWSFPEVTPAPVFLPPAPGAQHSGAEHSGAQAPVTVVAPLAGARLPPPPSARSTHKAYESLPSPRTIRATLRSREGFRRAMIHKVVLGQPRALRPPS